MKEKRPVHILGRSCGFRYFCLKRDIDLLK